MSDYATHRIGVVVPVKNGASFIEETLRSITGQTIKPNRVVVVDNGSTDGTISLLERLHNDLDFELLHETRPGAAAARDTGWRAIVDCDLIAFCDADDVWHKEKLEKQVALYRGDVNRDLVCVYCANRTIDISGAEIGCSNLPSMRGFVHNLVSQGHPVLGSMSAVLIRRDALIKAGGFDCTLMADEDLDLFIRLSKQGRFDYVPAYLTSLRSHSGQTSRLAERLLRSKGQIINKYPDLYPVGSSFIESVRVEHMRIDLQARSGIARITTSAFYPLVFKKQIQRQTSGRAQYLLFPGVLAFSCWLAGRALIYASNRLARRNLASS